LILLISVLLADAIGQIVTLSYFGISSRCCMANMAARPPIQ